MKSRITKWNSESFFRPAPMLHWRKYWRTWCALWKPCWLALLCPAPRGGRAARAARRRPQPSQGLHQGHRRPLHRIEGGIMGHRHGPQRTYCCHRHSPGSPLGVVPKSGRALWDPRRWSTPILRIQARCWAHSPCITASRAVLDNRGQLVSMSGQHGVASGAIFHC